MERAYSVITVKSFDPQKRTFSGWATTPAIDRVGDIIEPMGVKAAADIPLLLHHDSKLPVGRAFLGKPTKAGVTFKAEIPRIEKAGALKDRTEEAWQSVESGIIRAVSVGFRPLENGVERMASGGVRFKSVEVMELSLVAIPANEEATIANVKRFELGGTKDVPVIANLPALDPRAIDLEKIDKDIAYAKDKRGDLQAWMKAEEAKHPLDQDQDQYRRNKEALGKWNEQLEKLHKRRLEIDLGESSERHTSPPAAAPPIKHRQWEIDEEILKAGAPTYPDASRVTETQDFWFEGYKKFESFWIEASQESFRKQDLHPDQRVQLDLMAAIRGISEAQHLWLSGRCAAIEQRLAEMEASGVKYAGTYQRASSYKRGSVVSHHGSSWVAIKDVAEGIAPIEGHDAWQLMVKRGRDGKDAK
ncbi:MAG: hypothetical protein EOQ28_14845 [Mesorhizobium sp.]|uniref:HK97 family phage prohead protease n=1 Tax=Mesorhizobium sp. TaxID=1871066 RepID=UPI000FE6A72D|nr:HK97 family phage prohead protease [Mesorhizobium sp.]RWA73418.1 MAG: hypothetical protein EOQ28_14845 [Mesorhizobium sp.]